MHYDAFLDSGLDALGYLLNCHCNWCRSGDGAPATSSNADCSSACPGVWLRSPFMTACDIVAVQPKNENVTFCEANRSGQSVCGQDSSHNVHTVRSAAALCQMLCWKCGSQLWVQSNVDNFIEYSYMLTTLR
jgi:hypothetical protein